MWCLTGFERYYPDLSGTVGIKIVVLDHGKEVLATTPLDAEPDAILKMPEDSLAPLVAAIVLAGVFVGLFTQLWWLAAVCALLTLASLVVWLWPEPELGQIAVAAND